MKYCEATGRDRTSLGEHDTTFFVEILLRGQYWVGLVQQDE